MLGIIGALIQLVMLAAAFILLWSPIILAVLYISLSLMGKKQVYYSLLSKIGFKPRFVRHKTWRTASELIGVENRDPFPRNSSYKHILPVDYHTNPEYCNSPLNSSYNTIGPGSWFKKI